MLSLEVSVTLVLGVWVQYGLAIPAGTRTELEKQVLPFLLWNLGIPVVTVTSASLLGPASLLLRLHAALFSL